MDINKQHGSTVEKVGMGLVCSVETFKKGNIQLVKGYQASMDYPHTRMVKYERLN